MIDLSDLHDDQWRFPYVSFGWKLSAAVAARESPRFDVCDFILEGIGLQVQLQGTFALSATWSSVYSLVQHVLSHFSVVHCESSRTQGPFHHPFGFKNLLSRRSIFRLERKASSATSRKEHLVRLIQDHPQNGLQMASFKQ